VREERDYLIFEADSPKSNDKIIDSPSLTAEGQLIKGKEVLVDEVSWHDAYQAFAQYEAEGLKFRPPQIEKDQGAQKQSQESV
jgi:hypothetical protein